MDMHWGKAESSVSMVMNGPIFQVMQLGKQR